MARPNPTQGGIEAFTVHHSAGSHLDTGRDLWAFHRRIGWNTCGYHFVVEYDGEVSMSIPPVKYISYGAGPAWNDSTVHICLPGHYHPHQELRNGVWRNVSFQPSSEALRSTYVLLCTLDDVVAYRRWPGHRELKATACPGDNLMPHVVEMRQMGAQNPRPIAYI
ncbi:MAG: N-acetylmuramoyl-L-alanine amidase [Rhodocyclaceae bacterium]|nr:N-acetylmuramoyl-L-alanine amidase [Rhodocyclaceae bacterium]